MNTPFWLPLQRFEDLVEEALNEIPDAFWEQIDNVAVVVEDWPSLRQRRAAELPDGHLLLGLYEGIPVTERHQGYGLVAPDKITIFRGPILSICPHDEDEVREQVRHTVIHELAHYFGISDERLRQLGAY
jgi:predicted Zn-dependent protease with MMP-like domain